MDSAAGAEEEEEGSGEGEDTDLMSVVQCTHHVYETCASRLSCCYKA